MRPRIAAVAFAFMCLLVSIHSSGRAPATQLSLVSSSTPSIAQQDHPAWIRAQRLGEEEETTTTTTEPATTTTTTTTIEPATTTTTEPPPPAPTGSGSVEDAIAEFFPDVYQQAWNVSGCESGHDPGAISSGGGNWGLFQINIGHKDDFESYTGQSWNDGVLNARFNAMYARKLYDGSGWGPWTCKWAA